MQHLSRIIIALAIGAGIVMIARDHPALFAVIIPRVIDILKRG